jgi:Spy/CpxP family protein refolding chaperone
MSISGISGAESAYGYYLTAGNAASNTLSGAGSSTTAENSPFANLDLTQSQQSSISQTFTQLQSGAITQAQAQSQITSVLTPAQQTQLQQNLQQLRPHHHRHHHESNGNSSSSSSSSSSSAPDTDAFGIPLSANVSSTGSIGDVASSFWAQSQTNGNT